MKYYGFEEEVYKTEEELEKAVQEYIEKYGIQEYNNLFNILINYYIIKETDDEDALTNEEIYDEYGFDLPEGRYYIIPKTRYESVEEKLKEKFIGYKLLDCVGKNGKPFEDVYPVYDGNVAIIDLGDKVILIGNEFNVYKYLILTKEEYNKLIS